MQYNNLKHLRYCIDINYVRCTLHNFIILAIRVPKTITFDEVLTKTSWVIFGTPCISWVSNTCQGSEADVLIEAESQIKAGSLI